MSSWDALSWAKKQQVGNPVRKLILILMCEKVDATFACYPSAKKLAREAECSRSTVIEHQRVLEVELGLVTIAPQSRANGSQSSNRIYINHPDAPHMQPGADAPSSARQPGSGSRTGGG
ncbi:hypothetical protein Ga0074812_1728, partial [Parafrankia irregularis]